ncbi:ABC transporter ATP-binding protein [Streptomyces albidoflavus]|uniref:ABC transporter ATP-binding protein n=1 Tax=Streptomyces albidoflavus TaxID=1886 RepID=UPI0033E0225D
MARNERRDRSGPGVRLGHARRVPYADPGVPDHRTPLRFLWWLTTSQRRRVLSGSLWGTAWMCLLIAPPYLMSRAIDDGLRGRDAGALLLWTGALLATGAALAVLGILRHRTMTRVRVDAAYRTVQVVTRHVTRLGSALPRQVSAGELTHLQAGDIGRIAQTLTVTGPGVGAAAAYAVTAVLLLGISPLLALVVLLGVPALALTVGPLLGRLHGAEGRYREEQGRLTALAGDLVAGLSVLNGIGGKRVFAARHHARSQALVPLGYRVAALTSWVQALTACLLVLFLAVVTWIGARMVAAGTITVGELVAVYGYVSALLVPVSAFIEGADDLPRGLVSARRVTDILALAPPPATGRTRLEPPKTPAELYDPESGLTVTPGRVTALVDHDAYLFAGDLRTALSGRTDRPGDTVRAALDAAAATDIADGLPDGLDGHLDDQARNVSGGQRQRLRLARALLAEPEVLLLVEPTSALDAHTEATVAARLAAHRRGRTTLVVTTSPLVLAQADEVAHLEDGKVRATGTHGELLATRPAYAALVLRGAAPDAAPRPLEGDAR